MGAAQEQAVETFQRAFQDRTAGFFRLATLQTNQSNVILVLNTLALGVHSTIACNTLLVLYRRRKMTRRIPRALFVGFLLVLGVINFAFFSAGIWDTVQRKNDAIGYDAFVCLSSLSKDTNKTQPQCELQSSFDDDIVENSGEDIPALLISILAQSYLVYRCFIIWNRRRLILWAYSLILLTFTGFGVLNVVFKGNQTSIGLLHASDSADFLANEHMLAIVPWLSWALALVLNVTITTLIVSRLLWMRSKIRSAFGKGHGSIYTGVAAILCESSLLYTLVVLIGFLALPGRGGTNTLFSPFLAQTECIASELIILRLAQGLAFTDETATIIIQSNREESAA